MLPENSDEVFPYLSWQLSRSTNVYIIFDYFGEKYWQWPLSAIGSAIVRQRAINWCWTNVDPDLCRHGPLAKYVKLQVVHAPGMLGTFSPPPRLRDPDLNHGKCVRHVPWCMPGPLSSGFLWSRWRGKRSRHLQRMHNLQFYVSVRRPVCR